MRVGERDPPSVICLKPGRWISTRGSSALVIKSVCIACSLLLWLCSVLLYVS